MKHEEVIRRIGQDFPKRTFEKKTNWLGREARNWILTTTLKGPVEGEKK